MVPKPRFVAEEALASQEKLIISLGKETELRKADENYSAEESEQLRLRFKQEDMRASDILRLPQLFSSFYALIVVFHCQLEQQMAMRDSVYATEHNVQQDVMQDTEQERPHEQC